MLRKILKWTGLVLLFLVAGTAIATAFRQHLTYQAPYPAVKASSDTTLIKKGKNIALVTKGCVHCHSPINNVDSLLKAGIEPPLAGAKKFETPFGIFYTPNITPDRHNGIGKMTDGEIARLIRYGVKSNGEASLPFMQGLDMSDEDMAALLSYLRSLDPVENKPPDNEFSIAGRLAKAFVVKPWQPTSEPKLASK